MAQFPALPLFTDAYLGDTTHLTTLEHGAYLLLLIVAWRSKECCLPNDDKMLARYTKLSPSQWQRIKPVIFEFFEVNRETIIQKRLIDERNVVKRLTQQRSKAGKASALKRNKRHITNDGLPLNEKQAPTPTPTPIKKIAKKSRIKEDWELTPKDIAFAESKGFTNGKLKPLAEQFLNYHLAKGSMMVKWDAAWKTWVNNDIKFNGAPKPKKQKGGY